MTLEHHIVEENDLRKFSSLLVSLPLASVERGKEYGNTCEGQDLTCQVLMSMNSVTRVYATGITLFSLRPAIDSAREVLTRTRDRRMNSMRQKNYRSNVVNPDLKLVQLRMLLSCSLMPEAAVPVSAWNATYRLSHATGERGGELP
jgi:hypothetical protein